VDLFDVARSCARRWYVFLPLLLIVAWFSYSVYSSVKPVYYSNAVIGLAPPSTRVDNVPAGVPMPRNGLLDIGGAPLIANMAVVGLREPSVVDRVVAAGGLPNYVSKMFPVPATMAQLPIIMIEATDADPAAVSKTLELVVAQAEVTLRTLQQQAQVPGDQMVAPFVVSPPSVPLAGMPSRTRSTIAIFVAGAGLAVLVTVLVDALLTRHKAKRRQRLALAEVDAEPIPVDPPTDVHQPTPAATATEGALEAR
jgi:hypothetical protein